MDKARVVAGKFLDVAEEVGSVSSVATRVLGGLLEELHVSVTGEHEDLLQ